MTARAAALAAWAALAGTSGCDPGEDAAVAAAGGCRASLERREDPLAEAYDAILAEVGARGRPVAALRALRLAGCAPDPEAVRRALLAPGGIEWVLAGPVGIEAGPVVEGGARFLAALGWTRDAIADELLGGGSGGADPEGAGDRLDRARELVHALSVPVLADPSSYREVRLLQDALECTEDVLALVDLRDGEVLLLHRYPGC